MSDYTDAKALGLTYIDRWGTGKEHHPKAERLMEFLKDHDFNDYGDCFCWKTGGDGDNGETLMYQLDAYFELLDAVDGDYKILLAKIEECEQMAYKLGLLKSAHKINDAKNGIGWEVVEDKEKKC